MSSEKLINFDLWCYECQGEKTPDNIQAKPCSNCGGRKCIEFHGGGLFECKTCKMVDLCTDCHSMGKCCDDAKK